MQPIWAPNGVFLPVFTHPQTGQKWTYDPVDPCCSLYDCVPAPATRPAQAPPTKTQVSGQSSKPKDDEGQSRAPKLLGGTSQLKDKRETAVERRSGPPRSNVTGRSSRSSPSSAGSAASTIKQSSVASANKPSSAVSANKTSSAVSANKPSSAVSAIKQSTTKDEDSSELEREKCRRRQAERQVDFLEWHRRNDARRLRLLEPLRPWGRRGWGEESGCGKCA